MIIGLLPTVVLSVYSFGIVALKNIGITLVSAALSEYIFEKIFRKKVSIGDLRSVLYGLLLALSLPIHTPWWICMIGGIFAVLVLKPIKYIHPVLGTKVLFAIIFFDILHITSAPLQQLTGGESVDLLNMMLGNTNGAIGTTSMIAILLGGAFLILMEVIDVRTPVAYILTFVAYVMLFSERGLDVVYLVAQICGESLMFGAWFMATDYETSPISKSGKIISGILMGILTGVARIHLGMSDGVAISILIVNLLVPFIEWLTRPLKKK